MNCICQRVYDTGYTGIPRIDARLRHQYEVYGEDCIRRAFDHANKRIPYTDTPRRAYCFVSGQQEACAHADCEHARYRPPDTVRKMRWYIEQQACTAHVHYPSMLDEHDAPEVVATGGVSFKTGGEERKYGTPDFLRRVGLVYERQGDTVHVEGVTALQSEYIPPNDAAIAEREAWEDAMFRLHKAMSYAYRPKEAGEKRKEPRNHQGRLPAQSIESFREMVAEVLYGVAEMTAGEDDPEAYLDAERKMNAKYERFWNEGYGDWTDEEIQAAYSTQ